MALTYIPVDTSDESKSLLSSLPPSSSSQQSPPPLTKGKASSSPVYVVIYHAPAQHYFNGDKNYWPHAPLTNVRFVCVAGTMADTYNLLSSRPWKSGFSGGKADVISYDHFARVAYPHY